MKIIWNSELYHYGQPRRSGRYKWGSGKDPYHHGASVPRRLIKKYDRLQEKLDKNHRKQDAINNKLSGPLNSRSINKMNKYNEKASKYEKRKNKAERKLEKGNDISRRQQKAIDKYNEFSSKADMAGSRTAKKRAKLGSLESEEQRIISKMNKLDKKLEKKYIKDVDPDDLKRGKEYLDSLDIMTKKIMDDYKGYDRFPYSGEASFNTYKGAREKAKALKDDQTKNLKEDMKDLAALERYERNVDRAAKNFINDYKNKKPTVKDVANRYGIDEERAADFIEQYKERRYK